MIIVVTLTSVNNLQASIAQAERQVQRDQAQVQEDSARLNQSETQLQKDSRELGDVQQQGARSTPAKAAPAKAPDLGRAIESQVRTPSQPPVTATTATLAQPAETVLVPPSSAKAQLNTVGQTIGTLINTTA